MKLGDVLFYDQSLESLLGFIIFIDDEKFKVYEFNSGKTSTWKKNSVPSKRIGLEEAKKEFEGHGVLELIPNLILSILEREEKILELNKDYEDLINQINERWIEDEDENDDDEDF